MNNITEGKFIAFFYGLVDTEAQRLTYANAGHNCPITLRRDKTVLRFDEGGPVLGVFPDLRAVLTAHNGSAASVLDCVMPLRAAHFSCDLVDS